MASLPADPAPQQGAQHPLQQALTRALSHLYPRAEGAQYGYVTPSGACLLWQGLATRRPPLPVTPRTAFHGLSATKPVTALAVMQLAAAGHLNLDDALTDYLPDIPYQNGATLREVLTHQAGLPNPLPFAWVHPDDDHDTFHRPTFIAEVLRAHPRCRPPGERARYSNVGFLLLGQVVEVVSGLRFEAYVREHVIKPTFAAPWPPGGDASCDAADDVWADPVLGFDHVGAEVAAGYTRRLSGAGLLVSVTPDPQRLRVSEGGWIRYRPFHLNGAAFGGLVGNGSGWLRLLWALARRDEALLPSEAYAALLTPQPLSASGGSSGHALAWFVGYLGRHPYVCHAGGGPGYYAEVRIYTGLGAASALLTNTTGLSDLRRLDKLDACWLP